ncbi:MAG: CTP synthase [Holdemanella sp.]|nr:CTP synthase [Holdemanella sp.]
MRKYIFVTGGVVSGLGKGITAASLGRLLKERGFKVISQKMDPYVNVDCGTMSPYQHGEVFVTEDGAETDLDLGHYERFIDEDLNKYSNLTSGKVYWNVLNKERRGEYLGKTIQIIPHITNEIKDFIEAVGKESNADIVICEIGGTTGDIESQPFIEAIRQIGFEVGKENCCYIHVTLVPYIKGSDEYKSKPTQHSVNQLQSFGIHPNIIVTRSDDELDPDILEKIALFCNVKKDCVIQNITLPTLYEAPLMLEKANFAEIVCRELGLDIKENVDTSNWKKMVEQIKNCQHDVTIGLVGKYVKLHDAYLSVVEALKHGGYANSCNVSIKWIDSEQISKDTVHDLLHDVNGIIVPGGFGDRGIEGMIVACEYARTNNIPYFGICLGMQICTIEYARNVLGYKDANSGEFTPEGKHNVIDLMETQKGIENKGGTMRLGAYPCQIQKDTLLYKAYQSTSISERHRHRYEFNNEFREDFIQHGLTIAGTSPDHLLVECVEYTPNHFHLGVQYHPEFKSRPNKPHPLFVQFIKESLHTK